MDTVIETSLLPGTAATLTRTSNNENNVLFDGHVTSSNVYNPSDVFYELTGEDVFIPSGSSESVWLQVLCQNVTETKAPFQVKNFSNPIFVLHIH